MLNWHSCHERWKIHSYLDKKAAKMFRVSDQKYGNFKDKDGIIPLSKTLLLAWLIKHLNLFIVLKVQEGVDWFDIE